MSKTRRHFTAEQKAEIVRRHVAGKEPVSDLADEFGLQPSLIHGWVNQVLAQAVGRSTVRPASGVSRRPSSARSRSSKTSWPTRTKSSPSCYRSTCS